MKLIAGGRTLDVSMKALAIRSRVFFHLRNKSDVVSVITSRQTAVSDLAVLQAGQHQVPSALWRACSEQNPCYVHIISSKSCQASQARGSCSASGSSERCCSSNCSSRRWQVFFYLSCAALLATLLCWCSGCPIAVHTEVDCYAGCSSWNDNAYEFVLENQAGQGLQFRDPEDRKALVMGLAFHEQGKQQLEKVCRRSNQKCQDHI